MENQNTNGNENNGNSGEGGNGKGRGRSILVMLVISIILTLLFWKAYDRIANGTQKEIPYSGFIEMLEKGEVNEVEIYSTK